MATLFIHTSTRCRQLHVAQMQSVREALDTTDLRVRAACGGIGSCGACTVRVLEGDVRPPTLAEYQKLTAEERACGIRLACQLHLNGDTHIQLDHPARPSLWHSLPPDALQTVVGGLPALTAYIYGLAIDLGTTHIRIALWDRKHGRRIASRIGPNPQHVHGADVLNRLDTARDHPKRALEMAKLARTAIIQAVRDMLARDVGEVKPMLAEIGQVLIVGNTAMLCLLTGHGINELLNPDNWETAIACQPADLAAWHAHWYMPHAHIQLPEPIAGFVGSDLTADLLATGLCEREKGAFLLDVGTNIEIALWDGQHLHITSVPGGPAFEGVGIRNGMPAETGAIYRIDQQAQTVELKTIGDEAYRGFCGSGLVDAMAVLLAQGVLKPSGRFAVSYGENGYLFDKDNVRTGITGHDVDAFQRAKAAIAAAMEQLLALCGMDWQAVQRLYICGAFGHYLNIAHAQAVGLLPPISPDCIELMADATLAGCEKALLAEDSLSCFADITKRVNAVNMSCLPDYENRYINHLLLRPVARSVCYA